MIEVCPKCALKLGDCQCPPVMQEVPCPDCDGTGSIESTCPRCGGDGCKYCRYKGALWDECDECGGTGEVEEEKDVEEVEKLK
jgi:DnaJ-class molecular chaperone